MKQTVCAAVAAIAAASSGHALAADLIGYVSITGGATAHFEDLAGQFPSEVVDVFGSYAFKGSYPSIDNCANGVSGNQPCGGGAFSFSVADFGTQDLDALFSTGGAFGQSGTEAAEFWTGYTLVGGDRIITTFHRNAPGDWTSPTNPSGAVPEPASWALMILGFGAAGALLRRRCSLATA